jgi:hypothetical protein
VPQMRLVFSLWVTLPLGGQLRLWVWMTLSRVVRKLMAVCLVS